MAAMPVAIPMVVLINSPFLHADFVARHRILTQSSTKFTLWHKDFAVSRFTVATTVGRVLARDVVLARARTLPVPYA